METKANYLLIGVFTLLGFLGILGFFAWFSKVELDRQYAYYDVYFENVSGLDRASTVKFAGLAVGQVVDMSLAESGDGSVRVRLEVAAETPVRIDSEATIEAQGVTGVSFVGISAGSPEQPLLRGDAGDAVPDIIAGKSTFQTLTEDAPRVIDKTLETIDRINGFLSDENRAQVDTILANLASASADLESTLADFSTVAQDVGASVSEISGFTGELEGLSQSVDSTLQLASGALETIDAFARDAQTTLEAGTKMLTSADETVSIAGQFIEEDFKRAINDMTATSEELRAQMQVLGGDASKLLVTWEETGSAATTRLNQAEDLLTQTSVMVDDLTQTLETIDTAAASFDTLMSSEGVLLIAEARNAVSTAERALIPLADAAESDLPAILEDVRAAARQVEETVRTAGADLSAATGRVDGISASAETALTEASTTMVRARETLDAFDSALGTAQSMLESADSAFAGADRVINTDIGPLTADLRGTIDRLNTALDQVSTDLPGISADLRRASNDAAEAARNLDQVISGAAGPVDDFVRAGLPQYTQLANESRRLVQIMESLVSKIERDPARFLLGGSTPEYRRR
ncbi:MAG: ABC transporter substrate-binding protein [Rhodobacterales bacterium]|nr:MAG: ABC transporter substrate-binding protein [Rhodobacterales bacterium]